NLSKRVDVEHARQASRTSLRGHRRSPRHMCPSQDRSDCPQRFPTRRRQRCRARRRFPPCLPSEAHPGEASGHRCLACRLADAASDCAAAARFTLDTYGTTTTPTIAALIRVIAVLYKWRPCARLVNDLIDDTGC